MYSLNKYGHWDAEYNMIILHYGKKYNIIVVGQPYPHTIQIQARLFVMRGAEGKLLVINRKWVEGVCQSYGKGCVSGLWTGRGAEGELPVMDRICLSLWKGPAGRLWTGELVMDRIHQWIWIWWILDLDYLAFCWCMREFGLTTNADERFELEYRCWWENWSLPLMPMRELDSV